MGKKYELHYKNKIINILEFKNNEERDKYLNVVNKRLRGATLKAIEPPIDVSKVNRPRKKKTSPESDKNS